jgi:hypothetical protein
VIIGERLKNFLKKLDVQDLLALAGLSMLGYGLFLFNPPLMYIIIGSILFTMAVYPSIIGHILAIRRGK